VTAAAGGLTVKAALAVIPGTAVAVVSYHRDRRKPEGAGEEKTPAELANINRDKLNRMKVPSPIARIFIQKAIFNPHEQTLLVGALANMKDVSDRKYFIETAIGAHEESVAVFLRVRAQLMDLYQEKTNSVVSLVSAGGVSLMLTKTGTVVGVFPLDYVGWTAAFARQERSISNALEAMPDTKGKELWITGTVDPWPAVSLWEGLEGGRQNPG